MSIFYQRDILNQRGARGSQFMGHYKVNVIEAIRIFFFVKSFRLPPYGTRVTFTIHTSHILLHLAIMALREQSCADDNLARWRKL